MSFDSGPGAYTPPPPKRGLSPWAWVGIGCGTITLLGFGGCAILSYQFMQAVNNAMSPEESMKALQAANIPVYPGSEMDAKATKVAGGTVNLMGKFMGKGVSIAMVAFQCPETAPKVHSWYAEQTKTLGFSPRTEGERNTSVGRNMEQHMYSKGDEIIMIQTQDPEPGKQGSILVLAHFKGLNKKKNVDIR